MLCLKNVRDLCFQILEKSSRNVRALDHTLHRDHGKRLAPVDKRPRRDFIRISSRQEQVPRGLMHSAFGTACVIWRACSVSRQRNGASIRNRRTPATSVPSLHGRRHIRCRSSGIILPRISGADSIGQVYRSSEIEATYPRTLNSKCAFDSRGTEDGGTPPTPSFHQPKSHGGHGVQDSPPDRAGA